MVSTLGIDVRVVLERPFDNRYVPERTCNYKSRTRSMVRSIGYSYVYLPPLSIHFGIWVRKLERKRCYSCSLVITYAGFPNMQAPERRRLFQERVILGTLLLVGSEGVAIVKGAEGSYILHRSEAMPYSLLLNCVG
jgi:hypothetical protein